MFKRKQRKWLLEELSVCLLVTNGLGSYIPHDPASTIFLFHKPVTKFLKITARNSFTTVQYRINGNKTKYEAVSKGQEQKVPEWIKCVQFSKIEHTKKTAKELQYERSNITNNYQSLLFTKWCTIQLFQKNIKIYIKTAPICFQFNHHHQGPYYWSLLKL